MVYIRAVRGYSHGVTINPTLFSLKEIPWSWKEDIFHTSSCSNDTSILRECLWAGGSRLTGTWQACFFFFSFLNPQDSSSRERMIDWTGPNHEPRMVLYRQSKRPDHACIHYFKLRGTEDANLIFHQSSSDAIILYDKMLASALDKVVTFAGL